MHNESLTPEKIVELKKIQRKAGLYGRNQLSADEKKLNDNMITLLMMYDQDFLRANIILSYLPAYDEVDVSIINNTAAMLEKKVAFPVWYEDGSMIAVIPGEGEDSMETDEKYGIRKPVVDKGEVVEPEKIDLVIVPCTAFDPDCRRVGRGKGYYDRFLPKCTNAASITVAYERQKIDRVITDEHDFKPDKTVTEAGWYPKNAN